VVASIPRPYEVIRSLIINPATGKPIEEMTLMEHFEKELHQAQGSVDLLCANFEKKSWRYWAGTGATNSNRAAWIILEIF
jgi:hypothetical protein